MCPCGVSQTIACTETGLKPALCPMMPWNSTGAGSVAGATRCSQIPFSPSGRPVCLHHESILEADHNGRPPASVWSGRGSLPSAYKARARPSEIPARRANWARVCGSGNAPNIAMKAPFVDASSQPHHTRAEPLGQSNAIVHLPVRLIMPALRNRAKRWHAEGRGSPTSHPRCPGIPWSLPPAPWGARWGAIVDRRRATQSLLKRSIPLRLPGVQLQWPMPADRRGLVRIEGVRGSNPLSSTQVKGQL